MIPTAQEARELVQTERIRLQIIEETISIGISNFATEAHVGFKLSGHQRKLLTELGYQISEKQSQDESGIITTISW